MEINKYIDSTLLKANATKSDIEKLCQDAIKNKFYAVCVNPSYVEYAKNILKETDVKVCTVIGFPLGQNTGEVKLYEAKQAVQNGADEVDVVLNVARLIENDSKYIEDELSLIKSNLDSKIVIKVICETALLDNDKIVLAIQICEKVGVDYIKTSTGFSTRGASLEDVKTMKSAITGSLQIKASGGISTREFAEQLINLGATRIGTSRGNEIIKEEV